jgi:hypothetical protein
MFINLGDVDRSAHAGGQAARTAVLADTDAQVGALVTALQDSGRWDRTVLFVVSDHGMNYSTPGPATLISTQAMLDGLGACFTPMKAIHSGGTESIYVLDRSLPLAQRQAAVRAARGCALGLADCATLCPGAAAPVNASLIEGGWYTTDDPVDPAGNMPASVASRHRNLGDLTLFAKDTGKFGEPNSANADGQIPGNHGMPITLHNTFVVAGGSPWVKKGQVIAPSMASPTPLDRLPEQSENVDVAPTVAWLLGLDIRAGDFPDAPAESGFDGRILKEAFTQFDSNAAAPPPTTCGSFD